MTQWAWIEQTLSIVHWLWINHFVPEGEGREPLF